MLFEKVVGPMLIANKKLHFQVNLTILENLWFLGPIIANRKKFGQSLEWTTVADLGVILVIPMNISDH